MIIANPIYDLVFKALMKEERLAKFFVETLLNEFVHEISFKPQEFVAPSPIEPQEGSVTDEIDVDGKPVYTKRNINLFRLDFIATIRTADGSHKKVLIELQKARKVIDVQRFRNYLGEQYKTVDYIEDNGLKKWESLPIIAIYLLGFELPDLKPAATKVARVYRDMHTGEAIEGKDSFVERLTHDCYVVQLPKVKKSLKSRLDRILNLFEQDGFIAGSNILKDFDASDEYEGEIIDMAKVLNYVISDKETRKQIEAEIEFVRMMNVIEDAARVEVREKERQLAEKEKALEKKNKAIEEKDRAIEEKEIYIQELLKKIPQGQQ